MVNIDNYSHKNKSVDKDVYEAALILVRMSRDGTSITKRVFGPVEPVESTRRFVRYQRRRNLKIGSLRKPVDDEGRNTGSTSTNIVDEEPPPDGDDQPIINNNEQVLEEAAPDGELDRAVPPALAAIANIIGACSPPFGKQLTKSDVTDGQGRLTLWKEFVNLHLVPLFNEGDDLVEGIDVTVFNAEGREYDMTFKLWASKLYVLMRGWKEFYKTNNLTRAGEDVTLWMFRHVVTGKLCCAIIQGRVE